MAPSVPRVQLSGEYTISRIIRGSWQLAGGHGPVDRAAAIADLIAFADAGITTLDSADIYTGVEELLGEFLRARRAFGSAGGLPQVGVHTKYVPDLDALSTLTARDVEASIDRSRRRLGVDALDLVQFHWWDYGTPGMVETAHHLAVLARAGKVRHIGVTNCDTEHLTLLLDAGIPVVSHQLQYSLLDRRPARAMAAFCLTRHVQILCYGVLAGGFLSERWLDVAEPAEPLDNRSLVKYKLIIDEFGGWRRFQELLLALAGIAARHHTTIGAVAICWTLDQPGVTAAIVGARNAKQLEPTIVAATLQLTTEDRADIDQVLGRARIPDGDVYALERDRTGRHGRIMRYNLSAT